MREPVAQEIVGPEEPEQMAPITLEHIVVPQHLLTVPEDDLFPTNLLRASEATRRGDPIRVDNEGNTGTPLYIGDLMDHEYVVRLEDLDRLLVANPWQPRRNWIQAELKKLAVSMCQDGQLQAVIVVPFSDGRKVRLFIIDGESRKRAIQLAGKIPYLRVVVRWAGNEEEILRKSLISNEGRSDLNPIELANAYSELLRYKTARGLGKGAAIVEIAAEVKETVGYIRNHLQLLERPREVQELVIRGMPPAGARFLSSEVRALGKPLEAEARAARWLLDHPEETLEVEGDVPYTARGIRRALVAHMITDGESAEVSELLIRRAVAAFQGAVTTAVGKLDGLLAIQDRSAIVDFLRERARRSAGSICEETRDNLLKIFGPQGQEVLNIYVKAINPDPVPERPDKPEIGGYVRQNKGAFKADIRHRMAVELAKISALGSAEVLTVQQLAERLRENPASVKNHINNLDGELIRLGIRLERHTVRERQGTRQKYKKIAGYRLIWMPEARKLENVPASVPTVAVSAPASAPAASAPTPTAQSGIPAVVAVHDNDNDDDGNDDAEGTGGLERDHPLVAGAPASPSAGRGRRTMTIERLTAFRARKAAMNVVSGSASASPVARPPAAKERRPLRPHAVGDVPNSLKDAAGQIVRILAAGDMAEVCGGTKFGNKVGLEITASKRPGGALVYVIRSNLRGFALNFAIPGVGSQFVEIIRSALGGQQVEVAIMDL